MVFAFYVVDAGLTLVTGLESAGISFDVIEFTSDFISQSMIIDQIQDFGPRLEMSELG